MNFKVEDKVIVTHKGLPDTCWVSSMNSSIGKEFTVIETSKGGRNTDVLLSNGWWYPIETIMKMETSTIDSLDIF